MYNCSTTNINHDYYSSSFVSKNALYLSEIDKYYEYLCNKNNLDSRYSSIEDVTKAIDDKEEKTKIWELKDANNRHLNYKIDNLCENVLLQIVLAGANKFNSYKNDNFDLWNNSMKASYMMGKMTALEAIESEKIRTNVEMGKYLGNDRRAVAARARLDMELSKKCYLDDSNHIENYLLTNIVGNDANAQLIMVGGMMNSPFFNDDFSYLTRAENVKKLTHTLNKMSSWTLYKPDWISDAPKLSRTLKKWHDGTQKNPNRGHKINPELVK